MLSKLLFIALLVFVLIGCTKESMVADSKVTSSDAIARYKQAIAKRISDHWIRPDGVKDDERCMVNIEQNLLGEVLKVDVMSSDICSPAMAASVERAVLSANPLPVAGNFDSRAFDRNIKLTFAPRF